MKFGELLAASLISGWEAHYFDYWGLKEYIKRNTMELEGRKPVFNHQEFVALFQKEERRVALFVNGKLAEIVNELEFEMSRTDQFNASVAQQLGAQVIKFDRFVADALNAQEKILKKYRKWTGQQTAAWFNEKTCSMVRAKDVVHSLVVALSWLSERQWASSSDWVPPDSFQRKTVKYWVRPEHATAAKLFIIQHLPILEVNKTPSPPRSLEGMPINSQIHNYLSSVYMDNDAADCYHRRIALEEGANLLRVRWYGGEVGPDGLPRPNAGSVFFMELKTHHNPDVSGLKSTKERFPITAQMIPGFMTGKLTSDQVVDAMIAQGHIKPAKAVEQKELAAFIQNLIVTLKLKPWIRTVYHRTAFQRSDSNEVRISFDLPLILHPELPTWNGKEWMDLFKVDNSNAAPFGYGILEVKTSEEPPEWVQELLATGWLIRVEKFSKFQHATAIFHREAVSVMPYWIGSDIAQKIHDEKPDHAAELVEKTLHAKNSTLSTGSASSTVGAQLPLSPLRIDKGPGSASHSPHRPSSPTRGDVDLFAPLLSLNSEPQSPGLRSRGGPRSKDYDTLSASAKCKSDATAAAPPTQGPGSPTAKVAIAPPPARGTNLTRMRVEPKVFFANERTFLKWMFAVVILISVSMTVMSISNKSIPYGVTLLATACVLIIYALGLYKWRLNRILKREGTRFDDRVGPFLIGFCLLAAACVVFAFAWTNGKKNVFVCQHPVPSCSPIFYQIDPRSTTVSLNAFGLPEVASTIERVQTCITADSDYEDPAGGDTSGSSSSGSGSDKKKKSNPTKPTIVWDVNNTFIQLSSSPANDLAITYLKYEEDLKTLTLNVRSDSPYAPILLAHLNQTVGQLVYETKADCSYVALYYELTLSNVNAVPTTVDEINTMYNVPLLTDNVSLTLLSVLRSRYTFANVKVADQKAIITVLPGFPNIDDRAMQINSIETRITVQFLRLADQWFTYSSLRQAQSFLEALFAPDERIEDIKARWKQ